MAGSSPAMTWTGCRQTTGFVDLAMTAATACRWSPPSTVPRRQCGASCASNRGSRHLQQDVRQPLRLVHHHVVAGVFVDECLPGTVGLAVGERLVEGLLRIARRAD